ncbi:MAG TPA: PCP reductase family protein [Longimicrobiales bacterium]
MKFLCLGCDEVMHFAERRLPGDGTMAAVFACARCGHEIAMLTNPMETHFVSTMGVEIGGRTVPAQPMELVRGHLAEGRDEAFEDAPRPSARHVTWSAEAAARLQNVPPFVRGMVKRIYTDYASEHGIAVITPDVMDRARAELGLEGM